ncbi:T9SS type A sorting domain-containing protein [uncultured Kordia sp.]|uniref:T9SS type A sorting domain-containing protein n=1 Tax=uncultured Kordia sp. TaxID=507699 RepID=UPI0026234CC1|nr:T9SS type A sorting domain-containing protein [uncultured Kordia sp.]
MKKNIYCAILLCIAFTTLGFSQVNLGDDITTCEGETVILDATTQDATSYQWSVNGQVIPNETTATYSASQAGVYEVTAMINGSPSSDTITISFNPAPIIGNISNFFIQGTNGNTTATFDLTSKIQEITNGDTDLTVTFYESAADAQANTNPIANPTSYQNLVNLQNIFVRVENINTGCSSVSGFVLEVINESTIYCSTDPGITTFCYGNDDSTQFIITNADGLPVMVEFLAGEVESSWDELNVYDSDGTALYIGYGNNGDLTGLIFESTGDQLTIQITSDGSISCGTNSFEPWQFTASCGGNSSGIINTQSFLDENNNGVFDTGEVLFPFGNVLYELNDNGEINVGSSDGSYFIVSADANNSYDLSFSLFDGYDDCYSITTPTIDDVSVAIGESITVYFPITELQPCEDLEVVLVNPAAPPRPGFDHYNLLYLNNLSLTTIASGTVEVVIDDQIVFNGVSSINPNYTVTNTATGFTIDFVNLEPLASEVITIDLFCPVTVPLGDIVVNTATYTTTDNDLILENNHSVLRETVVGSWDPNDITESRGPEIIHPDFTSEDYLYYTIRFQNLGTAEAINVRIEETLNTQVDETTFQMIASSHAYQVRRTNDELVWNFDDINLPAEMFDAEGSNGFVHFKIKPKAGYAIGDIIPAQAGIYFDFNAPVITNNFLTEFIEPLSVNELLETQIKIYPNPVTDILYIKLNKSEVMNLQLVDIHGKQTLNKSTEGEQIELNVSSLKSGIYFLKLNSNTTQFTKKIIVN